MTRPVLHLDLETRSRADLRKVGLYKYAEDPSTDVILACWAINDGRISVWRAGEPVPSDVVEVIKAGGRILAHNASFERILLRHVLAPRYGWPEPATEQWDCSMARARAAGLPGSLDGALRAMGAPIAKDAEGYRLMLRMCKPRRVENDGTVVWWDDEERISRLAAYCAGDVQGERWLDKRIPQLIEQERQVWLADQRLNDRGVPIDVDFCKAAIAVSEETRVALDREMSKITGRFVPKASNVGKLRTWLLQEGVQIAAELDDEDEGDEDVEEAEPELRRNDVERLLQGSLPDHVRRALEIRLEAGKSSVKKVNAMLARVQADGRVRGMLSYYGAATGRWSAAGSGIQLQNLPRASVKDWEGARESVELGASAVEAIEGPPLDVLSRMLRGTIKAPAGRQLIYADLSSVEARGVAWLAGQDDLVRDFASGAKMYEAMAADIFSRTFEEVIALGKESYERFVGKQTVLGCGYGMGPPKFAAQCVKFGQPVTDELAELAVRTYRTRFPWVPALWYALDRAAQLAVRNPGRSIDVVSELRETGERKQVPVQFEMFKRWLVMHLPTGSRIFYRNPRIVWDERFSKDALAYDGQDSKTKRWGEQRTYGGRLTENAVQRICRDIIAFRLPDLEQSGYDPILLVHDETITETDLGHGSRDELVEIMCRLPSGLAGFPLAAEGSHPRERYAK